MCVFVVRSFCIGFLLNVCVGGGAHYPGEFGVLEHPLKVSRYLTERLAGIPLLTEGLAICLKPA